MIDQDQSPPRSPETYGRHPVDAEGRWRRMAASPFFIIGIVGAGFLLLGMLLVLAMQFQSTPSLVVPGAMRATMLDGSLLWLRVTTGTQHDFEFTYPETDALQRIFDPTGSRHVDEHTGENRFVIWLMRQDPRTGRPLDFDWWSHSSVIDEHGREVVDTDPHRDSFHAYGSRSEGGSRPFSPLEPQEYVGIVVHSELPLFRNRGETFTLRIHNTDGDVVARFAVPYKLPIQPPTWVPEELPITKSRGELAVTLREVAFEPREYRVNGRTRSTLRIRPSVEVAYGGMPTGVWDVSPVQVSDALSNTASVWQCDLDPREPAWRLVVRAARTSEAEFSPDEMWQLPPLPIPEANKLQVLRMQDDSRFRLVAIGGRGKTTHNAVDPQRRSGGGSSSGYLPTADRERTEFKIDVDYQNGTKRVSIDSPLPYVAFELIGRGSGESLLVRGIGDDGAMSPAHVNELADLYFAFLEVPPSEKRVDLTFILHRTHELEFFIEPPPEVASGPGAGDQ